MGGLVAARPPGAGPAQSRPRPAASPGETPGETGGLLLGIYLPQSRVNLSYPGAAPTLEEVEGAVGGTTTSLAPALRTTGGGGEVPRRLPGTTAAPATTRATIRTTGDVSETASVPGLSSVVTWPVDTSAPSLSTGDKS